MKLFIITSSSPLLKITIQSLIELFNPSERDKHKMPNEPSFIQAYARPIQNRKTQIIQEASKSYLMYAKISLLEFY